MQRSRIISGELLFEKEGGFLKAIEDGYFRIEVPEDLDLNVIDAFNRCFYQQSDITGNEDIYFDRDGFQTEHILVSNDQWPAVLPPAVTQNILKMESMARAILKNALAFVGIPIGLWDTVTGDIFAESHLSWFAASHYRKERDFLGCPAHKDTGFITLLHTQEEGLEYRDKGVWRPIPVTPGALVVHFGQSFEVLTANLDRPVHAILHRVRQTDPMCEPEKHSFAVFLNSFSEKSLYRMTTQTTYDVYKNVGDYLKEFNTDTWKDYHGTFGIE